MQTLEEYLKQNTPRGNVGNITVVNNEQGIALVVRSGHKRAVFVVKGNSIAESTFMAGAAFVDADGYTLA